MRLGLRYVKGLRAEIALELLERARGAAVRFDRGFEIARAGDAEERNGDACVDWRAEFYFCEKAARRRGIHRRDALWQIERASRRAGPLLERAALEAAALENSGADGASKRFT